MPTAEAVTSIADAASDASAEASALIARPFAVRRFLRVAASGYMRHKFLLLIEIYEPFPRESEPVSTPS